MFHRDVIIPTLNDSTRNSLAIYGFDVTYSLNHINLFSLIKLWHVQSLISKERLDRLRSHHTHATKATTSIAEPYYSRETNAEIHVTSVQSDTCTKNVISCLPFIDRSPTPISRDLSPTRRVGDNIAKNR